MDPSRDRGPSSAPLNGPQPVQFVAANCGSLAAKLVKLLSDQKPRRSRRLAVNCL